MTWVWVGIGLQVFVGVMAVPVGLLMVADPHGSPVGIPHDWIADSPFGSFLVPGLFLLLGGLAAGFVLAETPSLRIAALLAITIWSFCRAYYFAFYVIEHYIDSGFKFSGLGAFVRYVWRRRTQQRSSNAIGVSPCDPMARGSR